MSAGFLWFGIIFYALLHGIPKARTWCAFAGLCLSAFSASVFDWGVLTDFQQFGELSFLNFVLSWLLLIFFLLLAGCLVQGKFRLKQLGIAAGFVLLCGAMPFCLWNPQTPKRKGDIVYTSPEAPLALYDEEWNMKSVLPYCGGGFRIPLRAGFFPGKAKELLLFGDAAEYAPEFPESRIIYVHPPEFFDPAPNTAKIFLSRHDTRIFPFEAERR